MSLLIGKPLVQSVWPERLAHYNKEVQARRAELLNYIIFLRVTPILPNVFINVASPIVEVPLLQFTLGKPCIECIVTGMCTVHPCLLVPWL